jgi:alkylation response protein AidB-like acyl-CoA dehydrogenase
VSVVLNEDQEQFRKSVRSFLARRSPEGEVRRLSESESGYDPGVWTQMADQLGLQGLIIPEKYGGSGGSHLELAIALEEMGRSLLCAPYLSTVGFAVNLLLAAGDDEACAAYLPAIASGSVIATVAWPEDSVSGGSDDVAPTAHQSAGGWLLDGRRGFVVDGCSADLILVAARAGGELALFALSADARGLTRTAQPTVDRTRRFGRLEFASAPASRLVHTPAGAGLVLSKATDLAAIALAAEQVGGSQRLLDMSVEYAKLRVQFGRPIGTFQAIKHKCAEMLLEVESAKSAAYHAAAAATAGDADLPVAACVAKATASDAYVRVAADAIQVHGGVGFTWEHPAHLYYKRALSSEHLLGDATFQRELLAQRLKL